MEDHKRQQALDNFRNALGRLEQSDFIVTYSHGHQGINIFVSDTDFNPEHESGIMLKTISNHTLKLKKTK